MLEQLAEILLMALCVFDIVGCVLITILGIIATVAFIKDLFGNRKG